MSCDTDELVVVVEEEEEVQFVAGKSLYSGIFDRTTGVRLVDRPKNESREALL